MYTYRCNCCYPLRVDMIIGNEVLTNILIPKKQVIPFNKNKRNYVQIELRDRIFMLFFVRYAESINNSFMHIFSHNDVLNVTGNHIISIKREQYLLEGTIYEGKMHALEFYSCKHNISSHLYNKAVQFAG